MKKGRVLDLIRYNFEKKENSFIWTAQETAKDFLHLGDNDIAQNILDILSTNSNGFSGEFVKSMDVKVQETFILPTAIAHDIKGLINAIKKRVGINKILFEGMPGTGKTEAVKNIAKMLNRQLYYVDFDNLIGSLLGQTNKNITQVFSEIGRVPYPEKSIILFDEIDIIALDRISHNDIREMGRATSSMLRELDRLSDSNKDIIIIATTNLYENFDKALSRRFDTVINFNRYSQEDLIEIGISFFFEFNKIFKRSIKDLDLLKKILLAINPLPHPSQLKNIIKTALAFSDENNKHDYLRRIYESLVDDSPKYHTSHMETMGFSQKEIKKIQPPYLEMSK